MDESNFFSVKTSLKNFLEDDLSFSNVSSYNDLKVWGTRIIVGKDGLKYEHFSVIAIAVRTRTVSVCIFQNAVTQARNIISVKIIWELSYNSAENN